MRIDALPAYVMTPDAKQQATSVVRYKDIAPPAGDRIPAVSFHRLVIDGIVRNSKGEIPGGPDVMIPPPATASLEAAGKGGR